MCSIALKFGVLQSSAWSPKLNLDFQKSTNVQLWVCFYLNQLLWHPQILSDLAPCIGILFKIDQTNISGEFDQYAKVLVDLDMDFHLPESILLNNECASIIVELFYENMLHFCNACGSVGHAKARCHRFVHFDSADGKNVVHRQSKHGKRIVEKQINVSFVHKDKHSTHVDIVEPVTGQAVEVVLVKGLKFVEVVTSSKSPKIYLSRNHVPFNY